MRTFKPWWLVALSLAIVAVIGIREVLHWDGNLDSLVGAYLLALGMGLRDLFGSPEVAP